ncbi:hypothetical protein [Haliscomenobacter hydrossis]|uniref:Uncharacterized protein n=1 Tax=Haliscomenobacter hydrossis (strain ATCC 27775 / DSM 1100 / LMG 10767 / O) TaxID=760192 RepID=F4KVH9_HALH1|nr:hypothetical protein [Haliscomenobacter hydrossis]AEE51292.1 hypothetical protein Halhy_3436 [Haliscomenobacter hydrossis DSM 1100]
MNAQATITDTPFYSTTASWHEVSRDKTREVALMSDYLNEKVNIKDFGKGLNSIWFVAIIMQPDDKIHTNEIVFHRKKSELAIYWRMDYDRVMSATLPKFKAYLAEFFVEVLHIAKAQKKIKDFEMEGFIGAVEKVLKEWVEA